MGRSIGLIRRQAGMTLIEVMISVLILVIGLLGLAAMQTQSVKFNDSARWRSQATFLAYDIVERIRANKTQVTSYVQTEGQAAPSGSDVASMDKQEWLTQLALINGGNSTVAYVDSSKKLTVTIKISDLTRTQANATDTVFVYTTLLD